MVEFKSTTMDELEEEILQPDMIAKLGREATLSVLIGLEYGMAEVDIETHLPNDWLELNMSVETSKWREVFKANEQCLIDCEEYELLALTSQLLKEDNDLLNKEKKIYD